MVVPSLEHKAVPECLDCGYARTDAGCDAMSDAALLPLRGPAASELRSVQIPGNPVYGMKGKVMYSLLFVLWLLPVCTLTLGAMSAFGQAYPSKPIRIVVSAPGGGTDLAGRLIAQGLTGSLGHQVIVENRGGANGAIAGEIVAHASPDGYTLLLYSNVFWTLPFIQKVPYDVVRDFSPITLAVTAPNIVVVHPSLPVKSIAELIALAKASPGKLNYASSDTGGAPHLAAELFKAMAGVDIVRIPFKGAGPAVLALVGGEVNLMFGTAGAVAPHIKSGKLRALAVTSGKPSALFPGLPTVAASGLRDYESLQMYGVFAPAKTSSAIISLLNKEIVRLLNAADMVDRFASFGVEAVGTSPGKFSTMMRAEMQRLGKVIKDAGIRAD